MQEQETRSKIHEIGEHTGKSHPDRILCTRMPNLASYAHAQIVQQWLGRISIVIMIERDRAWIAWIYPAFFFLFFFFLFFFFFFFWVHVLSQTVMWSCKRRGGVSLHWRSRKSIVLDHQLFLQCSIPRASSRTIQCSFISCGVLPAIVFIQHDVLTQKLGPSWGIHLSFLNRPVYFIYHFLRYK